MKRYVVKDAANKFHVIEVEGFIPAGSLGEAPAGATTADGPFILLVNGVLVLDSVAKAQAQAAIDAALEADRLNEIAVRDAKARLKALDIKSKLSAATTVAQVKQILVDALPDLVDALVKR